MLLRAGVPYNTGVQSIKDIAVNIVQTTADHNIDILLLHT